MTTQSNELEGYFLSIYLFSITMDEKPWMGYPVD